MPRLSCGRGDRIQPRPPAFSLLTRITLLTLFTVPLFISSQAEANIADALGYGSRSASLGGNRVAITRDSFAAYNNPAGLPLSSEPNRRFTLTTGFVELTPSFTPINGIVVENTYTSDTARSDNLENVDQPYRDTFGQLLGFSFRILPESHDMTVGVATFLPLAA